MKGFTLVEILVAFVLAFVVLSLLLGLHGQLLRGRQHSQKMIETLENAIKLLHQLERDLSQLVSISGKPLTGYVLRLSKDHRSLVIRSAGEVVTYQCRQGKGYSLERRRLNSVLKVSDLAGVRFDHSVVEGDLLLLRVRILVGREKRLPLERLFRIPIPFGESGEDKPLAWVRGM